MANAVRVYLLLCVTNAVRVLAHVPRIIDAIPTETFSMNSCFDLLLST